MQIHLKNQISQRSVITVRRSGISQIISDVLSEVRRTDPCFLIYLLWSTKCLRFKKIYIFLGSQFFFLLMTLYPQHHKWVSSIKILLLIIGPAWALKINIYSQCSRKTISLPDTISLSDTSGHVLPLIFEINMLLCIYSLIY